jgi:flagellar biosynthesis protein FlhA
MAIDADLSAGLIDHGEANRRRESLSLQADFYGAMDGASKFVRGDAIAAIAITAVNILGGLAIGLSQKMDLAQAVNVFTRLTIGEGLACQIPAFLIAIATGILLTRNSQTANLPSKLLQQLFGKPSVLAMAAVFLALLVFTRLPPIPLLSLAALCGFGYYMQTRRKPSAEPATAISPPTVSHEESESPLEDLLRVDLLEIEIGVNLVPLADPKRGGDLLQRIADSRMQIATELGLILPKVRIRDNLGLPPDNYRIRISSVPVAEGSLLPGRLLARPTGEAWPDLDGSPRNPFNSQDGIWIELSQVDIAAQHQCAIESPTVVLAQHLKTVVSRQADLILTRDATRHLIDQVRRVSPAVVDELIPEQLKLADVQQVLQNLLREGISIRRLALILEALGDYASRTKDLVWLTEFVRARLAPSICQSHCDRDGVLNATQLPSALEEMIAHRVHHERGDLQSDFSIAETQSIVQQIQAVIDPLVSSGKQPIVLVGQKIRPSVKRLTHATLPGLVVLSHNELTPDVQVRMVSATKAA